MTKIPLIAVPNYKTAFNLDGAYWQLRLYMSISFVCADISRNGVPLINGIRCFSGIPLLPYSYMTSPNYGNFIFDADVDWENFEDSCNLYYLNSAEFGEYKSTLLIGASL